MIPSNDSISYQEPLAVLGLDATSTNEQIRAKYLELVKQYPPERDPDRFAEIRAAYEMASNPVERWALCLCVEIAGDVEPLLARFHLRPQRLPTEALLKCGEQLISSNKNAS